MTDHRFATIAVKKTRFFLLFCSISLLWPLAGLAANVQGVRLWTAPDHTRLVFDIDQPIEHKLFTLSNPDRLVLDIHQSRMRAKIDSKALSNHQISGLRHAPRQGGNLRIVLDLKGKVRPKSFLLKPNEEYGNRLVLDMYANSGAGSKPTVAKSTKDIKRFRDVVIAVDAGHGGEDPGASGSRHKTKEKKITLEIARRVKRLLDRERGFKGTLTRKGDYYVGLRKRMKLARRQRADFFVSIHADAFRDSRVRGSSVYVLSRRGSSSEAARWLAEKENAADLVGGISLDDKDQILASVLLDLSQSATQQASLSAARGVYRELHSVGKVHGSKVQQAGFVVLKSPDIPSMLVETGFISNPAEERNLNNPEYQEKMARSIVKGIKTYFKKSPPPDTILAQVKNQNRRHVIRSGETLSGLAERYRVSMVMLKQTNSLRTNQLRIGQVLRIPET